MRGQRRVLIIHTSNLHIIFDLSCPKLYPPLNGPFQQKRGPASLRRAIVMTDLLTLPAEGHQRQRTTMTAATADVRTDPMLHGIARVTPTLAQAIPSGLHDGWQLATQGFSRRDESWSEAEDPAVTSEPRI